MGFPPFYAYFIQIAAEIALLVIRANFAHKCVGMHYKDLTTLVIKPILIVTAVVLIVSSSLQFVMDESFLRLFVTCSFSSLAFLICLNFWGLSNEEKQYVIVGINKIKSKFALKRDKN